MEFLVFKRKKFPHSLVQVKPCPEKNLKKEDLINGNQMLLAAMCSKVIL